MCGLHLQSDQSGTYMTMTETETRSKQVTLSGRDRYTKHNKVTTFSSSTKCNLYCDQTNLSVAWGWGDGVDMDANNFKVLVYKSSVYCNSCSEVSCRPPGTSRCSL